MKNSFWKILLGASVLSLLFLASCAGNDAPSASTGGESTGDGGSVTTECEHGLVRVAASTPTCEIDGAVEHYLCWKCNQYYLDANAETATTQDEVVLSALGHDLSKTEAVAPTCSSDGNVEYYTCSTYGKYFADEAAAQRLTEAELTEKGGHLLTKTKAKAATCTEDGNIEHYACGRCGKYYLEASATTEITAQEAVLMAFGHEMVKKDATPSTCTEQGNVECYHCSLCEGYFTDEAGESPLDESLALLPALNHNLVYYAETQPSGKQNGNLEHWRCSVCETCFKDEKGETETPFEEIVVLSLLNTPDFLVEIESGRDPVVLQLSDPQIMYTTDVESRSNYYIKQTIEAVKPDLILVTGDLIYGRFDTEKGEIFTQYVAFMESFEIPWAPVFGNHDNECPKGVDWQCEQLEKAEYCLFKQGEVTGNGNYSVGIEQDGKLLRVFYMMDSNGCSEPSAASKGKVKETAGFGQDQIDWYSQQIRYVHHMDSSVKISFVYHIQQGIFERAFQKYDEYDGVVSSSTTLLNPLNLDTMPTADDTDFGYLGRKMKSPWDTGFAVFNEMKQLGVDSIFVGHEHCNSASIVYDGVRFQYGQKSSTYDRYNWLLADGTIAGGYTMPSGAKPLVGGTVIPVSKEDGSIGTGYIYFCDDPFDVETAPEEISVDGLRLTADDLQAGYNMMISAQAFDETVNAYKVYSEGQGKIFLDPALASQYKVFSFSVFVPEDSAGGNGWEFALRAKPNGTFTQEQGCNDQKYIYYSSSGTESLNKVLRGEWTKVTVDISGIGDSCTEFSIMLSAGTTMWIKDVAFTD
jgi:hypothetical protein